MSSPCGSVLVAWLVAVIASGGSLSACMDGEYVEKEEPVYEPAECSNDDICHSDCIADGKCSVRWSTDGCLCSAVSAEDCEQSIGCELDGECSLVDGECRLTGPWDCQKTMHCQNECVIDSQYGGCSFDGVECYDGCA